VLLINNIKVFGMWNVHTDLAELEQIGVLLYNNTKVFRDRECIYWFAEF